LQELSRRANGEISRGKSCSELGLTVFPELATHRVERNYEVWGQPRLTVGWSVHDTIDSPCGVGTGPAILPISLNSQERIDALYFTIVSYGKIGRI
jgi:hypothetical protein